MPEKKQENGKGGEPEQEREADQNRSRKAGFSGGSISFMGYQPQKGKSKKKPLRGYRPETSGDDSDGEPDPPGDE